MAGGARDDERARSGVAGGEFAGGGRGDPGQRAAVSRDKKWNGAGEHQDGHAVRVPLRGDVDRRHGVRFVVQARETDHVRAEASHQGVDGGDAIDARGRRMGAVLSFGAGVRRARLWTIY